MEEKLIITASKEDIKSLVEECIVQSMERIASNPPIIKTYTLTQAAKILKISKSTLRSYVRAGHVTCSYLGSEHNQNYRFTEEQLQGALKLVPISKKRT